MYNLDKNFKFKKQFGQNFIFDKNFLISLNESFNIADSSNILEIGAGAGTLTEVLAQSYKKVVSIEIDKTLKDTLFKLSEKYNNLNFIFNDVLNLQTNYIDDLFNGENYYLVANLPYYITSQIIFKFLLESTKISGMYVMVQKEVGERFCATHSTKDYGVPTVLINTFGQAKIVKNVNRKIFNPIPNVDSCVINIDINRNKFDIKDINKYQKFIMGCFQMKRKTLNNNLLKFGLTKEAIVKAYSELNFDENIRPENLSVNDFVSLFKLLFEN